MSNPLELSDVRQSPIRQHPGRCGLNAAYIKKPWAAVSRAAGLESVRIHDLRHSFASFGAGASAGLPIIGRLLVPYSVGALQPPQWQSPGKQGLRRFCGVRWRGTPYTPIALGRALAPVSRRSLAGCCRGDWTVAAAQTAVVAGQFGERTKSALWRPLRSGLRTGGKRKKAVFGRRRGCVRSRRP